MQRFFAQKDFFLIVSWLATLTPQAVSAKPTTELNVLDPKPTIAIIVDDLGYDLERGHRILQLPGAITISILPFTPHARELAEQAAIVGKEVLLHLPLESENDPHEAEGTLKLSMTPSELQNKIRNSIESIPGIVGVNNHTGSLFTQNTELMRVLMTVMNQHKLFFVDSRTTASSVAVDVARSIGIPVAQRDVFLDHRMNNDAFESAYRRVWDIAKKQGHAILVAHPYEKSIRFLSQNLDILEPHALVPVSQLVNSHRPIEVVQLENPKFFHKALSLK